MNWGFITSRHSFRKAVEVIEAIIMFLSIIKNLF